MNLKAKSLLNKLFNAHDKSLDWLIASWERNINPYERKVRRLRYYQYSEKSDKLAKKLYLLVK